ncbi:hypothetical protein NDU88_006912 [Pleurodeles waltl]|uniref:Uncharacterized protein n=1 Tax=Pleurodeles waltl TaxID=8319 RepID=A0AAV7LR09_PLEWA|nr:hypothetical protein NDU88_006912 [Pleurodeles waltl]
MSLLQVMQDKRFPVIRSQAGASFEDSTRNTHPKEKVRDGPLPAAPGSMRRVADGMSGTWFPPLGLRQFVLVWCQSGGLRAVFPSDFVTAQGPAYVWKRFTVHQLQDPERVNLHSAGKLKRFTTH